MCQNRCETQYKTIFDLQPFTLRDDDSIFAALQHSNIVINLIGTEYNTRFVYYPLVTSNGRGYSNRLRLLPFLVDRQ